MATKDHNHYETVTRQQAFDACVNPEHCNPSAHGGATLVKRCPCGAEQHINQNGDHWEMGPWQTDKVSA